MCLRVGGFMFWQVWPFISICVWFLEGFDLYIPTSPEEVCLMRLFWEILIPSMGMIKHDVINMLYYKHWKDKQIYIYIYIYIYIPYISVAQKMPKSCRCKIATLGHMIYLMYTELLHVYSNLLAKFFYICICTIYIYIYIYICVCVCVCIYL